MHCPDARLRSELDGIGFSLTLSVLWQATERTRLGLVYTSAADAELEGDLEFSNVGPVLGAVLESQGMLGADLEVNNTLPQRLVGGLYHELSSGRFVTAALLWHWTGCGPSVSA